MVYNYIILMLLISECCVQISDQVKSKFSLGLSLPQLCENFLKAAYDPRISGIYLHIDGLSCGWGKVEEIRRHILNFKKSGKNTRLVLWCSLYAEERNVETSNF
jgi:hypothetical protein